MVERESINLGNIEKMNTDDAREYLMKLPGVGPKVADCVLLYSGTKKDVLPTDVWVKRVMEENILRKNRIKGYSKNGKRKVWAFIGICSTVLVLLCKGK